MPQGPPQFKFPKQVIPKGPPVKARIPKTPKPNLKPQRVPEKSFQKPAIAKLSRPQGVRVIRTTRGK